MSNRIEQNFVGFRWSFDHIFHKRKITCLFLVSFITNNKKTQVTTCHINVCEFFPVKTYAKQF